MSSKTFVIPASGLKNVISMRKPEIIKETDLKAKNIEEKIFFFKFGEHQVVMDTFLAEYISPRVSHLHRTDPTINSINLNNKRNNEKFNEIFDIEFINTFIKICEGEEITIDRGMIEKILILSIFLENSILYEEMNKLYSIEDNNEEELKINYYLQYLMFYDNDNSNEEYYNKYDDKIIEFISSHFYLIDQNKLILLPKNVLYSIINNDKLKIIDEDSLFEFIEKLFSNDHDDYNETNKISKLIFYELIELPFLSETNFKMMIESIDYNKISSKLWYKMKLCFYNEYKNNKTLIKSNRYKIQTILYDNNTNNRFKGIIYKLYDCNPTSSKNGKIINITESSIINDNDKPENVIDYENIDSAFYSKHVENSWIKFDFIERKVNPSAYSIRSNNWGGKGHCHPQHWVIEGSNDDNNWTILDSHTNNDSIDDRSKSNTFSIQNQNNIFYRYLRLRQTGLNTASNNALIISAFEYFGTIQYF